MSRLSLSAALNTGLRRVLEEDPKAIILGEDVGPLGGVFRVTDGLSKDFGSDRVIDTPLAESSIVGTAIGLAMRGYHPVCEIQFDGFVYPAFNQMVSQLAKMRARTGGKVPMPVVIRIPCGGGIGAVEHHSESNEAYFAHTAGLRVVSCSDPQNGYWMLRQAVACGDPVVFYEPKRRYWDKAEVSTDVSLAPAFDQALVARAGSDVTVIGYGGMVATCLEAAAIAEEEGRSLEVVDLRSLSPLDLDTVCASVRKTGRCLVVHEAPGFAGVGAEVVSGVTERCFYSLEAPVLRVTGFDLPYPPAKYENQYLPDADRVLAAVDKLLEF
jgi:2-oxoisovalerate dehydrogenase E1 component beta subunit